MMFIDEMEPGEVEVCFCLNENQTEARQTTWVKYRECTRDVKKTVHKFQVWFATEGRSKSEREVLQMLSCMETAALAGGRCGTAEDIRSFIRSKQDEQD